MAAAVLFLALQLWALGTQTRAQCPCRRMSSDYLQRGIVRSSARENAGRCAEKGAAHWDYEAWHPACSGKKRYAVIEKIGRGKYSNVFSGVDRQSGGRCVIKALKPVRFKKVQREAKILGVLQGGPNIVRLLDITKEPGEEMPALVFEHISNTDFRELYPALSLADIRLYVGGVLQALQHAHEHGVMHRDVKPHNIMIDPSTHKLRLIDWGLAEFYHPGTEYNVRVASRYYKGPELLVDYRFYDYSLDMWGVGCVLAGMLFRIDTFFRGRDNLDQLAKIAAVLGSEALERYLFKYNVPRTRALEQILQKGFAERQFCSFVNEANRHLAVPAALDLLSRLLCYDHAERLTAREALAHPFFESK